MPKYRCTVTGGSDEQASRGPAPEIYKKVYEDVEAESAADADAAARELEHAEGRSPNEVVCELESILAIREATESALADPDRRRRLQRAAVNDGATMDEVEAAKAANGRWPR
jgi:hypothetical protein